MNEKAKIVPLILAGGHTSRLWPDGINDLPKQFLPLKVGGTTFQNALLRVQNKNIFLPPFILCAEQHVSVVESFIGHEPARFIYESIEQHTAAACSYGALAVKKYIGQSELILVLPADHFIDDVGLFEETVTKAIPFASEGSIVTFGVHAEFGHTEYGYIEQGRPVMHDVYAVKSFHEKPRIRAAHSFCKAGAYYWNTGIYLVRSDVLLAEMKTYHSEIYEAAYNSWQSSSVKGCAHYLAKQPHGKIPSMSFEKAVMEHTERAHVVYARFKWQDLGGWDALMEFSVDTDANRATCV